MPKMATRTTVTTTQASERYADQDSGSVLLWVNAHDYAEMRRIAAKRGMTAIDFLNTAIEHELARCRQLSAPQMAEESAIREAAWQADHDAREARRKVLKQAEKARQRSKATRADRASKATRNQ